MSKLRAFILVTIIGLVTVTFSGPMLASAAVAGDSKDLACQGIDQVGSAQNCSTGTSGIDSVAGSIVNILSYFVGIVAVIMIIIAGIKYATAAGDSNKAASARNTLIYALIGIAIAALAQVLVHFVLTATNKQ